MTIRETKRLKAAMIHAKFLIRVKAHETERDCVVHALSKYFGKASTEHINLLIQEIKEP